MLYQVQAMLVFTKNEKDGSIVTRTKVMPTFFLDPDILGINSEEHAKKIVEDMLCPIDTKYDKVEYNIHIREIE